MTLIGALLSVLFIIPMLGFGAVGSLASFFMGNILGSLSILVSTAAYLFATYLFVTAYGKVKNYKKEGWDKVIIAEIVLAAASVLGFVLGGFNGFGSLISSLIFPALFIYILFQGRDYFTGKASIDEVVV